MRQCEMKKRYDPNTDMYVTKHVYGEGISDVFKAIGRKVFGKAAKEVAKKAATTAATKAATTTGEYAGKKAGDKIIELLSRKKTKTPFSVSTPSIVSKPNELTQQEVNERVNQILSGGKLRRRNFI